MRHQGVKKIHPLLSQKKIHPLHIYIMKTLNRVFDL